MTKKSLRQKKKKGYQIVYQSELLNEVEEIKLNQTIRPPVLVVKPRGPQNGFFNRDQFKKFPMFSSGFGATPKLEFGFSPIKPNKIDEVTEKPYQAHKQQVIPYEDKLFDELDSFQAPKERRYANSGRSFSFQSTTPPPSRFWNPTPAKNRGRKSNLDFLGIFDTRKYFYIPHNRRSDEKILPTRRKPNILSTILHYLS